MFNKVLSQLVRNGAPINKKRTQHEFKDILSTFIHMTNFLYIFPAEIISLSERYASGL